MKKTMIALTGVGLLALGLSSATFAGDVAKLAHECDECHGKNGNSEHPEVPNIAGFSVTYLHDTLMDYKSGERPGVKFKEEDGEEKDMNEETKDLSEEDINALAEHYAKQTFKSHAGEQKTDPKLVAKGEKLFKRSCKKCHADYGTDPEDDAGILGGQWMTYLEHQFKMFHDGDREMPKKMRKKFKKLDEADYQAIIHALGSK
jgi:sulfide dehydrogenase cytochrome subunit